MNINVKGFENNVFPSSLTSPSLQLKIQNKSLQNVLQEYSAQIKEFFEQKRSKIEWKIIGDHQDISIDFSDRKQFDKKDDQFLLFKNINIPSIIIKDNTLKCKTAHFLSICKQENDTLSMINLKGKKLEFQFDQFGECLIQHLRFKETSFHHNKGLFQLVVIIQRNGNEQPYVVVSSPFLVESRKKPFQERAFKEQNTSTLFDPFLPSILDKQYNHNGQNESDKSKLIGDNLQSLIVYFSAQNIRHKVIHPLYLLFKFPNAISLFYNKNIVQKENECPEDLIKQLQSHIFETLLNADTQNPQSNYQEKLLILRLKKQKYQCHKDLNKVFKYMSFLEGPILTFFEKAPIDMPPQFQMIENIEDLKSAYCKVYGEIAQIKMELKIKQYNNQKQFHQVIESKGGIPSNDDFSYFGSYSNKNIFNSEFQDNNFKNSFHIICYDLRVKDQQLRSSMTKIPLMKQGNSNKQENQNDNFMEIEQELQNIQFINEKPIQQQVSCQNQFIEKINQESQEEYSFQTSNRLNESCEKINNHSQNSVSIHEQKCNKITSKNTKKLEKIKLIQNFSPKSQEDISQRCACFRNIQQNDQKIQIIGTIKEQQSINNKNQKCIIENSYLIKRKQDIQKQNISKSNEINIELIASKKQELKNQKFKFYDSNEKQPRKKVKKSDQNIQFENHQINHLKKNKLQDQSEINSSINCEQSLSIPFKSYLSDQTKHVTLKPFNKQNEEFKETEIYKKERSQGNTSSTASTVNSTNVNKQTNEEINSQSNQSSSGISTGSNNQKIHNEDFGNKKQKPQFKFRVQRIKNLTSNSSSENQNQSIKSNDIDNDFKSQNNNNNNKGNYQQISYQLVPINHHTQKINHIQNQNKMNVEKNQIDQVVNKLQQLQFKDNVKHFNQESKNNQLSKIDEMQVKSLNNFNLQKSKYLEGYESDEEFDYNNDEDEHKNKFQTKKQPLNQADQQSQNILTQNLSQNNQAKSGNKKPTTFSKKLCSKAIYRENKRIQQRIIDYPQIIQQYNAPNQIEQQSFSNCLLE